MSDSNESIMDSSQEETPATVQNTKRMDKRERKQRISLDQRLFDTIQRMVAKNENKDSIISATGLSRSTVYKVAKFIEENEPNATFMSYYNKSGRKRTDNKGLINTIKDVITIDNSYTQVGIKTQSKICKVRKQAGITRKRLKKKASIALSQDHDMHRYFFLSGTVRFCFMMNQDSIFTHRLTMDTQTRMVDAVSLENFEVIIGPFNEERFLTFLPKCFNERTFTVRPIVVMDNVRFHKFREVLNFYDS
ncbi:hypothetical protein HZS_5762 [Henneguya salminicola]|nr:hypothetical protein HZS_5762 [Henneguya salminicola]